MLLSLLQRWKLPSIQTKATRQGNRRKPLRCYPHSGGDKVASLAVEWRIQNIGNTVFAITTFHTHSPSPLHEVTNISSSEEYVKFKNALQAQKVGVVSVNRPNRDSLNQPEQRLFRGRTVRSCSSQPVWAFWDHMQKCIGENTKFPFDNKAS